MNQLDLYSALFFSILMLYIMIKIWFIKNKRIVHHMFFLTVLSIEIWDISNLITYLFFADAMNQNLFLTYLGITLLAPFLLLTVNFFIHPDQGLEPKQAWLFLIPAITLAVACTNGYHTLFIIQQNFIIKANQYGPYFSIHSFYSYACMTLAVIYLIGFAIKHSGLFSRQTILILLGTAFPVVVNVFVIFKLFDISMFDLSNSFSATLFLYWLAINRFDFLNVVPIAIQQVVNHISDGIMVLNKAHVVIFYNATLTAMLSGATPLNGETEVIKTGEKLETYRHLLADPVIQAVQASKKTTLEDTITIDGLSRYFHIEITPMFDKHKPIGTIVLFKDITDHKQYIATLESKNRELDELNLELEHLNLKLRELADKDGLTGAYNRRFFNEYYEMEIARGTNQIRYKQNERSQMNFGIAILDIDDFKKVNDTYGHITGDHVLKELVEVIKAITFSRDFICRYGGEEFAIIFTKTTKEGAIEATEKIRKAVAEHPFYFNEDNPNGHVTISIGLAVFDENYEKSRVNLLEVADERLYQAKHTGKNRVVYE
jgi:diguanylate cyclase (GGDEF)-like protein